MQHNHGPQHGDAPKVHGMLIVGEKTIYLYHLPMFNPPEHRYQVLLEAGLTREAQAAYVAEHRKTGTKFYTLAPERFSLPELVSTGPAQPPRTSFTGTVFLDVFDMGGTEIESLTDIEVRVANVLYFQKLDPVAAPLQQLKYLLFGKGDELFMAHVLTRRPDFDQVLSVTVVGHTFADEELRRAVPVVFPDRKNIEEAKLKAGEQAAGEAQVAGQNLKIQVRTREQIYFDKDMVNSP